MRKTHIAQDLAILETILSLKSPNGVDPEIRALIQKIKDGSLIEPDFDDSPPMPISLRELEVFLFGRTITSSSSDNSQ
jgi:hypothetical protein